LRVLAGAIAKYLESGTFCTLSVGVKWYPSPWATLTLDIPYHDNDGVYQPTNRPVHASGLGDISLAASMDVLEMLNPSMAARICPDTGDTFYEALDEREFFKNPHLALSFGVTAPTGEHDLRDHTWVLPRPYQLGAGVWTASAGFYFSQGIGRVTPGVGVYYTPASGANSVAYERDASVAYTAGLIWRIEDASRWRLYASVTVTDPRGPDRLNGIPVALTGGETISASVGLALSPSAISTLGFSVGREWSEEGQDGVSFGLFVAIGF
jgi:hypothetical protein